jgi:NAD(P)-dependent dehydrogenase (short-subunit alcohol dehydrogenase family)
MLRGVASIENSGTHMSIRRNVALVTGAGQAIGRAIALRLASEGADLAIVHVSEGRLRTPEMSPFVAFLAGPDFDYMTGQAPLIVGGLVY